MYTDQKLKWETPTEIAKKVPRIPKIHFNNWGRPKVTEKETEVPDVNTRKSNMGWKADNPMIIPEALVTLLIEKW